MVETKIFQLLCDLFSTMTELGIMIPVVHIDLVSERFYIPADRAARFRRDYFILDSIKKVMYKVQKQLNSFPVAWTKKKPSLLPNFKYDVSWDSKVLSHLQ